MMKRKLSWLPLLEKLTDTTSRRSELFFHQKRGFVLNEQKTTLSRSGVPSCLRYIWLCIFLHSPTFVNSLVLKNTKEP